MAPGDLESSRPVCTNSQPVTSKGTGTDAVGFEPMQPPELLSLRVVCLHEMTEA